MTFNYETFMKDILDDINSEHFLHSKDIPNIDLYMDQVTTFMDEHLVLLKRNDDQKILTKTMINNYSKDHLLPPSVKKKYTKNHMLLLTMIYYMKHILSITDIQMLLNPLKDMTTTEDTDLDLETFFDTMTAAQIDHIDMFTDQVMQVADISRDLYKDKENGDKLSVISTVYLLSMQAAFQRYLATALIDEFLTDPEKPKEDKKEVKSKDKATPKEADVSKDILKDIDKIAKEKTS